MLRIAQKHTQDAALTPHFSIQKGQKHYNVDENGRFAPLSFLDRTP